MHIELKRYAGEIYIYIYIGRKIHVATKHLHRFGYFQKNSNCLNAQLYKDGTQTNRIFVLLLSMCVSLSLSLSPARCMHMVCLFSTTLVGFRLSPLSIYISISRSPSPLEPNRSNSFHSHACSLTHSFAHTQCVRVYGGPFVSAFLSHFMSKYSLHILNLEIILLTKRVLNVN